MRKGALLSWVAIVAFAGLATWMWRQLEAERARNAALRKELAQLSASGTTRSETTQFGLRPRDNPMPAPPLEGNAPAIDGTSSEPPSPGLDVASVLADPDYRRAWRVQVRFAHESVYSDAPRVLGLSDEMADRFFELLVDQQWASNQALARQSSEDFRQKNEDEIAALLGPKRTKEWHEYQETLSYRQDVDRLRQQIGSGPDALRDDQVDALVRVYRDAHAASGDQPFDVREFLSGYDPSRIPIESTPAASAHARERQEAIDKHIREGASAVLTTRQLANLERIARREREANEAAAILDARTRALTASD